MLYLLGLIALGLAWLLPGHYYPWTSFHQEVLAAAGTWLVALAAVVTLVGKTLRVPFLASLAFALAVVPMLQWAAGLIPFMSDALLASAALVGFSLAAVAAASLSRTSERFATALFAALGVAAALAVAVGAVQWLQLGTYDFVEQTHAGDRVVGNLLQPNHLALVVALGAMAALWGFEAGKLGAVTTTLLEVYFGWGLVMTQSRAAWLFVLTVLFMWAVYRKRIGLRTPGVALLAWTGAFVLAVAVWPSINATVNSTGWVQSHAERMQQGHRWLHWVTIVDAITRSPWVGYGFQPVSLAQQAATLDHAASFEWLISSHNQWLDLLVWCGLPLGLAVTTALVWWASKRLPQIATRQAWVHLAALGVLVVHSMVEFPLEYAYFLLPAGLLVGSLEATLPSAGKTLEWQVPRLVYLGLLLAAGALLWQIVAQYLDIEEGVRRVRLRDAGYVQSDAPVFVPEAPLLDQPREYLRMWVDKDEVKLPPDRLQRLRDIAHRTPSPPALMRLATAEGLAGNPKESERSLKLMCHIMYEKHCDKGRESWAALIKQHPPLAQVPYPATPSR